ncbi:Ig-like domain-containing protein [Nocardioides sp.]|uniref:Ig-like domain-containing protein n=1 Tax=Nocardioides sp. TaxID=35761 RepID=UPI00273356C7|nr:Ig-like domain repeat protein [Nocardioides sp.]MDP3893159.1 Ig-like domain repeat protein [Nocardioides sp.]
MKADRGKHPAQDEFPVLKINLIEDFPTGVYDYNLMTTAFTEVRDVDGSDADWFDMGSGRIDLTKAAKAGFVLDVEPIDYVLADPAFGGDVRTVNIASMADSTCVNVCSWTRTLTGTDSGAGEWSVSVESISAGLELSVAEDSITLAEGEDVELTVEADATGQPTGTWLFGSVVLTPPAGSEAPAAHLPVAVRPSNAALPDGIVINTSEDSGTQESDQIRAIEIEDLQTRVSGLVPVQVEEMALPQDPTNNNPFDGGEGVEEFEVEVGEGAELLSVSLQEPTAPDFDLYVGTGNTILCQSASAGSEESCALAEPEAGTYWVLVQNWEASDVGAVDTVEVHHAVVYGDEGNLSVAGPTSVPANEPFTLEVSWNEPALEPGDTWVGAVTLGSSAGDPENLGTVPVTLNRLDDVVVPPPAKVKPKITIKPKKVKVQKKRKLTVTVSAPGGITPTGKVTVRIQGRKKAQTLTLNQAGRAKAKLPRYQKVGKRKVVVRYHGDAAVKAAKKKFRIRVVR